MSIREQAIETAAQALVESDDWFNHDDVARVIVDALAAAGLLRDDEQLARKIEAGWALPRSKYQEDGKAYADGWNDCLKRLAALIRDDATPVQWEKRSA